MADYLIENGELLDVTGSKPSPNSSVFVEGNRIAKLGPKEMVKAFADRKGGYKTLDASGRTIMPGMIDCHVHPVLRRYHLHRGARNLHGRRVPHPAWRARLSQGVARRRHRDGLPGRQLEHQRRAARRRQLGPDRRAAHRRRQPLHLHMGRQRLVPPELDRASEIVRRRALQHARRNDQANTGGDQKRGSISSRSRATTTRLQEWPAASPKTTSAPSRR